MSLIEAAIAGSASIEIISDLSMLTPTYSLQTVRTLLTNNHLNPDMSLHQIILSRLPILPVLC